MALNVIGNYFAKKSIKLSDAFAVYIQTKANTTSVEYPECVGFTVPKFEQEEDLMTYGNVSQTFLIPKYDATKEFSLTFYERIYYDENGKVINKYEDFFTTYSSYHILQKFNNSGLSQNIGVYNSRVIPRITIKVANNVLHRFVYKYVFTNCKIVNYNLYNLDYQSDAPCQITFNFTFDTYSKENINEDVLADNMDIYQEVPVPETKEDKIAPDDKPVEPKSEQTKETTHEEDVRNALQDKFKKESKAWEKGDKKHKVRGKDKDQVRDGKEIMSFVNEQLAGLSNGEATVQDFDKAREEILATMEDMALTDKRKQAALDEFDKGRELINNTEWELLQTSKALEQELTDALELESNREQALKDLAELDKLDDEMIAAANAVEYEQKTKAAEQERNSKNLGQSRQPNIGVPNPTRMSSNPKTSERRPTPAGIIKGS